MVAGRLRHGWPSMEATLGTTPRDGHRLAAERCALVAYRSARWTLPPCGGCARRGLLVAAQWRKSGERRCAAGCTMMHAAVRHARALVPPRFFRGGGRPTAAAPAPLRRCRDGWSEFF
ncbi:hypothetical protein F511_46787 [Dorcoceras hygrometricum]|uniref:Uncharacterized protein n=1 Tax=Dorcoceras hygrometricum TaxID=472368 RepID=A0A2Z6ZZH6_9LAMI|nr:hypothetical protein F511_46787 [Dorcoceras hygrometricum]